MAVTFGQEPASAPEWPVAQIPTEPAPDRTGGAMTPVRWPHHGDLRVIVTDGDVFVAVDDVHALADLDMAGVLPASVPSMSWAKAPGAELVTLYGLSDAAELLEYVATDRAAELLTWMLATIPEILTAQDQDRAGRLESFLTAYTVQQAAAILDRDPAVSIGRQSLFDHLELIGWAARGLNGTWQPTPAALRDRHVAVRMVTVRTGKQTTPYPQLYVTPAGLAELRRSLRALHPDAPATPPAPEQLPFD